MINELLEDYVTPLKNIVQNGGAFETLFSELRTALSEAQATFSDNPSMTRALTSTKARLQRVRKAVLDNFDAARQETAGLYDQHKTSSEILKGASSLLNRVHHEGAGALELTDKMKLARFTMRTVFQDEGLSSYLHEMAGYEPPDPEPIQKPSAAKAPPVLDRETLIKDARLACPNPESLDCLLHRFKKKNPRRTLRAYRYLLQSQRLGTTFQEGRKTYDLGEKTVSATPVQVTAGEDLSTTESPSSS
jgi:hypothetical protein